MRRFIINIFTSAKSMIVNLMLSTRQSFLKWKFQLMINRNPLVSLIDGIRFERSIPAFILFFCILLLSSFFVLHLFANIPSVSVQDISTNVNAYIIKMNDEESETFRKKAIKLNKLLGLEFRLYEVQNQQNFWTIASSNHINIDTIIGANPYLTHYYARKGQKLVIPNMKGTFHIVRPHERLKDIAALYGVDAGEIRKANGLGIFGMSKGDIIFIPDAYPRMLTEEMNKVYSKRHLFCSPISGKYTSGFGWRTHPVNGSRNFHTGLDFRARYGAAVSAAGSGIVICAGPAGGYGNCVIIQHANGYTTLYGHNSKICCFVGQKVHQGQIIAQAGNTGVVNATHVHFEIRKNGQPENPAAYLW